MVYKREVRGGVVYCPIVVQSYFNSVGNASGSEERNYDWFVHKRLEIKQNLLEAKSAEARTAARETEKVAAISTYRYR